MDINYFFRGNGYDDAFVITTNQIASDKKWLKRTSCIPSEGKQRDPVSGQDTYFSISDVEKAGLNKYAAHFISKEEFDNLLLAKKERETHKMRFTIDERKLEILSWQTERADLDKSGLYLFCKLGDDKIELYSPYNCDYVHKTIQFAIHGQTYCGLRFYVKRNDAADYSDFEAAFQTWDNNGNGNALKNQSWQMAICLFLQLNEIAICNELGFRTKAEATMQLEIVAKNRNDERTARRISKHIKKGSDGKNYIYRKDLKYADAFELGGLDFAEEAADYDKCFI